MSDNGDGNTLKKADSSRAAAIIPADVEEALKDPGKDIGRFVKIRLLGKGGWGEVWLAWEMALRRYVAIKFIHCQTDEDKARVLREAQTSATLDHPNIIPIIEAAEFEKQPFIVMKYVNGKTLDQANLPTRATLEVMRDVALAAHFAHERGVIHRDIKPANIIIEEPTNRPFLMDFGLARREAVDTSISVSGVIVGTPSFMPPEQARGKPKEVDARSDVYSLGATLYAILVGRVPIEGEDVLDVLHNVLNKEPTPPHKLVPDIPRELELIILKAMDKEKSRRYQSARELADDLHRYLTGEPVLARPASFAYVVKKRILKNVAFSIAVACSILIAFVAAGIVIAGEFQRAKANEEELAKLQRRAESLKAQAREAAASKNWGKSLEAIGQYLALKPEDPDAVGLRADCEAELGKQKKEAEAKKRLEESSRLCQQAIRDVAQAKEFWRIRTSKREQWEKCFDAALAKTKSAIEIYPDSPEVFLTIGEIKQARGRWKEAVEALDRAIALDSKLTEAWYRRGLCYKELYNAELSKRGRRSGLVSQAEAYKDFALQSLKKYAELRGDGAEDFDSRHAQAAFKYIEGKCDDAISICDSILKESATNEEVWLLKAKSHLGKNDGRAAREAIDMIISNVMPQHAQAHFVKGLIDGSELKLDDAIADFNKSLELDPENSITYTNRGTVFGKMGKHEEAIADFGKAIDLEPKFPGSYSNRAAAFITLGKLDEATADLNKAIELDPKFADAYSNLAVVKSEHNDFQGAVEAIDKAIELNGGEWEYRNSKGILLVSAKRHEEAIDAFTEAIRLNPNHARTYSNRAVAKGESGDFDGSIADFNKAIELDDSSADIYTGRAMGRFAKGQQLELGGFVKEAKVSYRLAKEDTKKATELDSTAAARLAPLIDQIDSALKHVEKEY